MPQLMYSDVYYKFKLQTILFIIRVLLWSFGWVNKDLDKALHMYNFTETFIDPTQLTTLKCTMLIVL